MTKHNYSHVTFVVDESGSMSNCVEETIAALDAFIERQRKLDGKCTVSLTGFDTRVRHYFELKPVADVESVRKHYHIEGMTALYDALGQSIQRTGEKLAYLRECDRPDKVLFVVLTDGQENSSREFSREKIAEMIKHQESRYSWDFVFMGASFDVFAGHGNLGVKVDNYASFDKASIARSFTSFADNFTSYHNSSVLEKGTVSLMANVGDDSVDNSVGGSNVSP